MDAESLRFHAQHATKRLPQHLDVMITKWNDKRLSHNVGFRFSTDNRALGEFIDEKTVLPPTSGHCPLSRVTWGHEKMSIWRHTSFQASDK